MSQGLYTVFVSEVSYDYFIIERCIGHFVSVFVQVFIKSDVGIIVSA